MSSAGRLGAVLEALAELGFASAELEGDRFVDASERFCELLGYGPAELLALPDVGPTLPPARRAAVLAALRAGAGLPVIDVLLRRDGVPVDVQVAGHSFDDGASTRRVLLVRDESDDARRREQLAAYAEVLQRMPMGMVLWRIEDAAAGLLRIAAVNRAATAGSGLRPAELVGRTMAEVFGDARPGLLHADAIVEAHRTRRLLDLGELVATEPAGFFAPGTYRRAVVPLPGDLVATLIENVSQRREAERHRRDLLQRVLDAGAEERRRVAVGLHDDVIQTLAATLFDLEGATSRLAVDEEARSAFERIDARVRSVIGRLRGLVFELHPPELEEGLEASVDVAADTTFAGTGVHIERAFDLPVQPDAETAATAYRIVAEALVNARRHADPSRVVVTLRVEGDWLVGSVADDGKGASDLVTPPGHLGLRTMRERAELLNGSCSVGSTPGEGTVVEFRLPVRVS